MKKNNEKKIFVLQNGFGLLPNCIVKKNIILQGWYCIAIEVGWLLGGLKIVLQYNYCITGKRRLGWKIILQYTIVL